MSEHEAEEEQEKEKKKKKAQGTRQTNMFKMHKEKVERVLMRTLGSRACMSVQLHHRCPVAINLLILQMFWNVFFFASSLQYYQNKQQN